MLSNSRWQSPQLLVLILKFLCYHIAKNVMKNYLDGQKFIQELLINL